MIGTSGALRSIVTTSWDDGHPLDVRLSDLLAGHGVVGTFYVPIHNEPKPVLDSAGMHHLVASGMEVGGHTLNHRVLTRETDEDVIREVTESKRILEDTLGRRIDAFCYPLGKFNARVAQRVSEAGYKLGRTTVSLRTDHGSDPFRMPVSMQVFPHGRETRIRHAVRYANLRGLSAWLFRYGARPGWVELARAMFDHVVREGGVFHLWGHSWEIEKRGLWPELEQLLSVVGGHPDVHYLTNSDVFHAATNQQAG